MDRVTQKATLQRLAIQLGERMRIQVNFSGGHVIVRISILQIHGVLKSDNF